jgi:hypothetical protein
MFRRVTRLIDRERVGCRIAQILPSCGRTPRKYGFAAPLTAAMCNDRLTLPTLTYISIGFVSNLIYAEEKFGADHNMLLIGRVWAHRDCQSRKWPGTAVGSRYSSVLSPQSVAIVSRSANRSGCRSGQASPGMTVGGTEGSRKSEYLEMLARGCGVTRILPGFTTNYIIPAKRSSGSVVVWQCVAKLRVGARGIG